MAVTYVMTSLIVMKTMAYLIQAIGRFAVVSFVFWMTGYHYLEFCKGNTSYLGNLRAARTWSDIKDSLRIICVLYE